MKKLLTAIVLFVFVALPMSVMAMTTITDNDLSAVTGQSGVSIGADITMNLNADIIAWGDADGIGALSGQAWVGLKDLAIDNLRIHMRADSGMADPLTAYALGSVLMPGAWADYAAFTADPGSLNKQKALAASILGTQQLLTIDVYTPTDISGNTTGKAVVRIGVPTFEVDMKTLDAKVGIWSDADQDGPALASFQKLGDIYVGGMVMLLGKDNYVDISQNNTASGILITVANKSGKNMIDSLKIDAMSWGDTDSLGGVGAFAGYVGLKNFAMTAVKVAASLNINVCTPNGAGVPGFVAMDAATFGGFMTVLPALLAANDVATKDLIGFILHKAGVIGTTSVDIALTANINIGTMVATAALGTTKDLANYATGNNTLGQIYINNMTVAIPAYVAGVTAASWVTISAH